MIFVWAEKLDRPANDGMNHSIAPLLGLAKSIYYLVKNGKPSNEELEQMSYNIG